MGTWTSDELTRIGTAEELQIAARRPDGTLRHETTIWVVRVEDDLYVRSVYGRASAWFRGVLARHEGHIRAGGVSKDVSFVEESDTDLNSRIDDAYRAKYRRYAQSIIDSIISSQARSATIKIAPHAISP